MQKLVFASALLILSIISAIESRTLWHQLETGYTFDDYQREFSKTYETPQELEHRRAIFENRLASIKAHNSDPSKSWKQGVNHLTDRTDQEMKAMNGYLGKLSPPAVNVLGSSMQVNDLPDHIDWREKGVVTAVKDQGMCGSCWTFGAVESLESMYAIATGKLAVLSEQQVLDCTPNPKECGGTGGCQGGTAELAYERLKEIGGLSAEWTYPYVSYFGKNFECKQNTSSFQPVAKISDYVKLPENQQDPIMDALVNKGPLVISVDASKWGPYESGVFDGCNQTHPDIDHAVLLVGYGEDKDHGPYWLVRNSWAPIWGEDGYIRLRRESAKEVRCGIDLTPLDGTGCKGGPPTQKVCGTCGILFDVSYPIVSV